MVRKLALVVVVPALLVVLFSGAYTLATGRSPRRWFERLPAALRVHYDEELSAAAARNPGDFRDHADPRVGYTLRTLGAMTSVGAAVHTDELGLRMRTGPVGGGRTIVVLGDSVAFGTGIPDDACLAQRLEDELAAARGADGPREFVCRTVAVPGWNWRNAVAFLDDHFDRLQPSIVLYMPIGNDLSDTEGVHASGHRRVAPDVATADPFVFVNLGRLQQLIFSYWPRVERGHLELRESDLGPIALNADLGGESSRRFDEMAEGIARLADRLAHHGVRFALLQYEENAFVHALSQRLVRLAPDLRWIPLLDAVRPEDQLARDPHPNATVVAVLARWTARELIGELHWADGRAAPAPPGMLPYETRRAPRRSAAEIVALAGADRTAQRALLCDAIEPPSGRGIQQIYGGLSPMGTVGPRLLAALPRKAGWIEVELAPLSDRDDLLPLDVELVIDGVVAGRVTIGAAAATASARARFRLEPLPSPRVECDTVDVKLVPERWGAIQELGGLELASCRLVRLARVDG